MNETIEQDFRRLFAARDIALYTTRIPSGSALSVETIAPITTELPRTASQLTSAAPFDVIRDACTTGATLIATDRGSTGQHGVADPVGRPDHLQAVILSCINLRKLDIIAPLEAALGKPVLSNDQVLAWQMATLARGLNMMTDPQDDCLQSHICNQATSTRSA